jgi:phosphoribosyl-ATP pyrophosphohydrolase/phosphoribosyl-AMP cyclohydrolase
MTKLDFDKGSGLIPAIIQDEDSNEVLMLGFMNKEAWDKTQTEGKVWFYSRSKKRLWMKGETTGNTLSMRKIAVDCDQDALLIQVKPNGPVCHNGTKSCFGEEVL